MGGGGQWLPRIHNYWHICFLSVYYGCKNEMIQIVLTSFVFMTAARLTSEIVFTVIEKCIV